MRFDVVTLFPEFFGGPLATGLVGKAIEAGIARVAFVDPRTFTSDRHRTVDDTPYGGGGGMVMKPEPLAAAIAEARARGASRVLLMSPQGRPLEQASLMRWSRLSGLAIVAGRYEGYDERVRALCDEEVSIGDFVLTGGEYAALVIIDGVVRLLPGTLGNESSAAEDSFSRGLLEHPQYTRPVEFRGERVPEVLLSGDHAKISAWRRARSLERTRARRPDLLEARAFAAAERVLLEAAPSKLPSIELAVLLGGDASDVARDLEAFVRLAIVYDLAKLHLIHPFNVEGSRVVMHASRAAFIEAIAPRREQLAVISASPAPSLRAPVMEPAKIVELARASSRGILLVLGAETDLDALLPSIRVAHTANALPRAIAAAILLDRLIGEG